MARAIGNKVGVKPLPWNTRFLASTRGKIVALLRGASRSVSELAEALEVSDNAVRAHITALERDGLVRASGSRRGYRKPIMTYGLTPEAEALFPKACGLLLQPLLGLLGERLPDTEIDDLLREAGHRLAAAYLPALQGHSLPERVERTLDVFTELGGSTETEQRDGSLLLRGHSCPFSAAVVVEPRVCLAAETLVSDLMGAPVRECCDRSEGPPRCCFAVGLAARIGAHGPSPDR